jgi:uncharacterized membrane protein YhhN
MVGLLIIVFLYLIVMGIYAVCKGACEPKLKLILKMGLASTYLGIGLYSLITNYSYLNLILFISFIFAWLGDLLLRQNFKLGALCFVIFNILLITHNLINLNILYTNYNPSIFLFLLIFLIITAIAIGNAARTYLKNQSIFISIYYSLIVLSGVSAAFLSMTLNWRLILGSLFFMGSDLCLLTDKFVKKSNSLSIANSILYFNGMLLLSLTYFII